MRGTGDSKQLQTGFHRMPALPASPLSEPQAAHSPRLTTTWRWLISVAIVLHLLAVVAEPIRFFSRSSRGTSPLADPIRWSLAPYVEFGYLNHGYFFFAPEPGPSHLIECRLDFGGEEGRLRFPDRQAQWPRLLYHRHFMLAEFLHQLHTVPVQAEIAGDDVQLLADWRADRARYEMIRDSMTRHLVRRYGAESASIDRLEHRLPSSDEVLVDRLPLNDPRLYIVLPDAPVLLPPTPLPIPNLPSDAPLTADAPPPGIQLSPGMPAEVIAPKNDSASSQDPP